jgi:hypothetical protein
MLFGRQWKGEAAVVLSTWWRRDSLSDGFMARRQVNNVVISLVANVQLIRLLG